MTAIADPFAIIKRAMGTDNDASFKSGNQEVGIQRVSDKVVVITDVNRQEWFRYRGQKCEQAGKHGANESMHCPTRTDATHLLSVIEAENKVKN